MIGRKYVYGVLATVCGAALLCCEVLDAGTNRTDARAYTGLDPVLKFEAPVRCGDLQITWTAISDSRCPLGAKCITEGQVVVTLAVEKMHAGPSTGSCTESPEPLSLPAPGTESARAQTMVLTLRSGVQASLQVFGETGFELVSVDPLPRRGVSRNNQLLRAQLRLHDSVND